MKEYYIVNLSHHRKDQKYITFWRPNDRGYAWPLSWAGRYSEQMVFAHLSYYNSGDSIPVLCDLIDPLAVDPKPGWIDGDAGPVVENTKANWDVIYANLIGEPKYLPKQSSLYKKVRT